MAKVSALPVLSFDHGQLVSQHECQCVFMTFFLFFYACGFSGDGSVGVCESRECLVTLSTERYRGQNWIMWKHQNAYPLLDVSFGGWILEPRKVLSSGHHFIFIKIALEASAVSV